ncbi:MAG TPA: HEAT repeat domain-containing protein [Phototrophicaceae bacterium]|nr:HEAT repeat domain-containing protein [Phototrophicaceae bacterium]
MPDLEAFDAEVRKNIKVLSSSKDAKARLQAAVWLGEAGEPTAVTILVQAYKYDRDNRVREAARYSLGMFRALEMALNTDEELVGQILEDVALNGKMGHRVKIPVRAIVKLEISMLLSAILIAGLAFGLPLVLNGPPGGSQAASSGGTPVASALDKDRDTLLAEIRAGWQLLNNNTDSLRREYQTVAGGSAPKCTAYFNALTPITLSENNRRDYPDVADLATRLNPLQESFVQAKTPFDQACTSSPVPLTANDVAPLLGSLGTISQSLAEIDQQIIAAQSTPIPAATEVSPPTEAGPTPTPIDTREHLIALQAIIDTVTDSRAGSASRLVQYWEDVQKSGGTAGCQETPPTIPADYVLPPDVARTSPNLGLVAGMVNTGLKGLRDGWQIFSAACTSSSLSASLTTWLPRAQAAQQAFVTASSELTKLRNGG